MKAKTRNKIGKILVYVLIAIFIISLLPMVFIK